MNNDTNNDTKRDQSAVMEGLYWWGVPTLLRCPHNTDPAASDIALVGVPHSTGNGTTERDQHLGPRAVRHVSAIARRAHLKFGFSPWECCRICDLGDVPLPEGNDNEASIARIADFYAAIATAGARSVSIGGDHSITGGIISGLCDGGAALTEGRKIALLHLDAHTDTFHNLPHFLGAKKSAAHWASYLVQEGRVDASKSVQLGIRGNPRTLEWLNTSRDLGYQIITKADYDARGHDACMEAVRERLGDSPVYITFDLDCLDPSAAPGAANIEAGEDGFRVSQASAILQSVRGLNIVGGDVVCLVPVKDSPNKITAMVAAAMMFELTALIADKHHRLAVA